MKKGKNFDKQEVEYKQKAGTAWSHSYLNQKPWHPLSYPNQRRKWIAEQSHAQRQQQAAEVAHEFAKEQEFFRQTSQMTKKEKEKMEAMQAVSFMYIRPPGYNAEAARAAEIADEKKRLALTATTPTDSNVEQGAPQGDTSTSGQETRKARVKDVFGRTLPTAEEFPALKNAPRLDTGAPVRVKPFAIEIRNVKCARCGAFGHQSGDRECPLKDVMMPNEEARLKRDDPLNVILAQTATDEPLKWELKQQPGGLSPARGGFKPDDPNQQIIPDEDIYDEYGGFLAGGGDGLLSIPNVLASLSREQRKELTDATIDRKERRKKDGKERRSHKHRGRKRYDSSDDDQKQVTKVDRKKTKGSGHGERRKKHSEMKRLDEKSKKLRRSDHQDRGSVSSSDLDERATQDRQKYARSNNEQRRDRNQDMMRANDSDDETRHIHQDRTTVSERDEHRHRRPDRKRGQDSEKDERRQRRQDTKRVDNHTIDQRRHRHRDRTRADESDYEQRNHRKYWANSKTEKQTRKHRRKSHEKSKKLTGDSEQSYDSSSSKCGTSSSSPSG